jgi:type II restriction/modification system DNA methylase subunit YeeA
LLLLARRNAKKFKSIEGFFGGVITQMNKSAIKTFAIESRKKLISEITHIAGLLGITNKGIAEPAHKSEGIEMYDIGAKDPYNINGEQIKQRASLASKVRANGFDNVIEEVAYTWFNRIIAIRFMEVNDYLPTRVRVLSSETEGKVEPDIVTLAPEVDLEFTAKEKEEILQLKHDNKLDEVFRILFIKQCNALNEILPELFEKTNDYTELLLSISFTNEDSIIRKLVGSVEESDFREQVEIIGWMYQYYNTELKDDTFDKLKKNIKITKERIPAATQLFTPDWIVRYMVENSLGRLWLEGHPYGSIKENWKYYIDEAEQEPDVQLQLEKLREERKNIKPEDIKIIDPCMGSGHILVYAFDVMLDIYKSCGYAERDAAKLILENNIYGLDIDDRAYQLAYFAVMMKARSYSRRILNESVKPNLCAIQESNEIEVELKSLNGGIKGLVEYFVQGFTEIEKHKVKEDFEYIIDVFRDAKEYGSILDVKSVDFTTLEKRVEEIRNAGTFDIFGLQYRNVILKCFVTLLKQAEIMERKYDVVVTNPPYAGVKGLNIALKTFLSRNYPDSKSDLFAAFIQKCLYFSKNRGKFALITPNTFLFNPIYAALRKSLAMSIDFNNLIELGSDAFEVGFGTTVYSGQFKNGVSKYLGTYFDVSEILLKEDFKNTRNYLASTYFFIGYDGHKFMYKLNKEYREIIKASKNLVAYGIPRIGLQTNNNNRFVREWHEIEYFKFCKEYDGLGSFPAKKWFPMVKGGGFRKWYGNISSVVNWENNGADVKSANVGAAGGRIVAQEYYFQDGLTWTHTTYSQPFSIRYMPKGVIINVEGPAIFQLGDKNLYVLACLNSIVAMDIFKKVVSSIHYSATEIGQFPILMNNSDIIFELASKNISISKADWDSFETSWDFQKHPLIKFKIENVKCRIEDAFIAWQNFTESQFTQLKSNEEELNRIFIEIYGLQDELTPEVEEKDVTIRKADLERDIKSFISYAVGCMLGRYSLDVEGLAYAGGDWDSSKYKTFIPDIDNIIPITDTEYFHDDIVTRFVEFVKIAFGADTLEENLDFIANALGTKGNTSREIIRQYFIKDFYKDHVKIYQKKPIYWLFDSGKENGFKALIYMHRYNQDTVARVRTD